jgi:hypothetical protein
MIESIHDFAGAHRFVIKGKSMNRIVPRFIYSTGAASRFLEEE